LPGLLAGERRVKKGVGVAEFPSGTVTFFFTDVEGSTRLWQEHPDAMKPALARHDEIVNAAIAARDGHVVKTTGDGFHAAFRTAQDALGAALDAQRGLTAEPWSGTGPLLVRMGLHTGETQERDGDYFGTAVNRAARVMAVAHGGQIICTRATVEVAGDGIVVRSLGEHRLRDLGAAQELFQVGEGDFPPLRSVDVVPTNLPTMLTELIGRSEEVDRLSGLLGRERMVTLTGVGGVGKTRLALAVAAASAASFPDGVWLVDLAPVNSPDEVVRAAAAAMSAPVADRAGLAQYLSDRRVLLVLDNCEHVLSDAASLAEAILVAGPEAVIVATSREPLGVDSETVRGVRSLAVPDPDADDAEVAAASAVRLFVERAVSATDSFVLSDANVGAVVQICAQLDGIPLAIELAAARVRAMSPAEIATRLGERFRLLSAGRGSQERHRTLQAAVSWSHDLLAESERRVFRRLAVFPASFDLDAAEAIAGDADTDVIDALVRLVEQSLVQYDATVGRYRQLETLRQYAADRLADADETELTRERHTDFYKTLTADNAHRGAYPSHAWILRFETETDNFHAVADWLVAHQRWSELLDLSRDAFTVAATTGTPEVCDWYRNALPHLPDLDPQDFVDVLGELEYLDALMGRPGDHSSSSSPRSTAAASGLSPSPHAWAARFLVSVGSDPIGANEAAQTMLAIARERDDEFATFQALGFATNGAAAVGDASESARFGAEVMDRAVRTNNPSALASAVNFRAGSFLAVGDPDFVAALAFLEAHPMDLYAGGMGSAVFGHRHWGLAYLGCGHPDRAIPHLTRAVRYADRRSSFIMKDTALALAVALGEAGQPALAAELQGYTQGRLAGYPPADQTHIWLGPRLAALERQMDAEELAAARTAGVRLNRRSFMRLLADAERRFDS
jgi:predicted ATPase/class 3 adenylate cyclase